MTDEKNILESLKRVYSGSRSTLMLDAQSDDCTQEFTALNNSIEGIMREFQSWVTDNSLKACDIWYADLFRSGEGMKPVHIASLFVEPDGVSVRIEPAPENSQITLFGRKPGIRRRLKNLKAQFCK